VSSTSSRAVSDGGGRRLSSFEKLLLALRVWRSYVVVLWKVRTKPLPRLTRDLGAGRTSLQRHPPELLSHAVGRCLRLRSRQARCLTAALVLFKLLREQGDEPVLAIGLPAQAVDHRAHAWIELDGHDVGPPPGKGRHVPLARYP
jgi:Transglutaminase-like superfamily